MEFERLVNNVQHVSRRTETAVVQHEQFPLILTVLSEDGSEGRNV
jgi:hypothetical protein